MMCLDGGNSFMYDSMIFDMDGTLVDFVLQMKDSWNASCKKYGWNKQFSKDQVQGVMGLNPHDIGVILFPEVDEVEGERRVRICSQEEIAYIREHMGKTFVPSEDFLIQLSKKYSLFIVSNCLEGYIEMFLKHFHFEKYFKDTVNAANGKSKAENIADVVKKHHLKHPVYIGDTIKDKESSNAAHVDFIHASYGFGKVDCEKKISELSELLKI